MSQEPRKASDILLQLENTVSNLQKMVSAQDQLLKIISNKLGEILDILPERSLNAPKISVEAVGEKPSNNNKIISNVNSEKNIFISAEDALKMDAAPQGFRRNSRPETFSGDGVYLNKPPVTQEYEIKFPTQVPRPNGGSEVVVIPDNDVPPLASSPVKSSLNIVSIPVKQRVVDSSGKSIFLADVEIFDENNQSKAKTRTNGNGKWSASLPIGNYKIVIKKRDSLTKEGKEILQQVQIDGTKTPMELSVLIFK